MVIYKDATGYSPYKSWAEKELDVAQQTSLTSLIANKLQKYGNSKEDEKWISNLGYGLHQLRVMEIRALAESKILLRVFIHFFNERKFIVLSGYDKGKFPSREKQQNEIALARELLTKWKESENGY